MEPWGTPQGIGTDLLDKYADNQFKAKPETPTHLFNLWVRTERSRVSKAAVRSRSKSTEQFPESVVKRRSFVIFSNAVSALWRALKPDWNFSKMQLWAMWVNSWLKSTFSRILERKGSLACSYRGPNNQDFLFSEVAERLHVWKIREHGWFPGSD